MDMSSQKAIGRPSDAFGIPGFNLDTPCMHRECLGTIRHPLDHPHMERLGMFLDV